MSIPPYALPLEEAAPYVGLSISTFQRAVREDETCPKPRQLTGRRVGYIRRELEAWVESRPISELLPPDNTGAKKPR